MRAADDAYIRIDHLEPVMDLYVCDERVRRGSVREATRAAVPDTVSEGRQRNGPLITRSLRVEPKGPVCVVAPRCVGRLRGLVAPSIQSLLTQRRSRLGP